MSNRYKRAQLETIRVSSRGRNKDELEAMTQATLDGLSSSAMIQELTVRGYRVFPEIRVTTTPAGWAIAHTKLEAKHARH